MTSEPLATKLAVLIRYLRDGRPLRGSGLRVGGRYILTADHCAHGSDHRIIVAGSEFDATVSVRSGTRDVDIAVLIAPDLPSVEPLRCARINTTISATVEDCAALGFPEWKKASGNVILAHAPGYVPTAEGQDPTSHAGRVPLLTLKITAPQIRDIPVEAGDLDQQGSKWAGMSGAVVISGEGEVLGVVRSHAPAEGVGSLTFTPLQAIDQLSAATAAALWSACGVYDPHALPVLPTSGQQRRLNGHDEPDSQHRGADFSQLPPDIHDFTGREEQIDRIADLISGGRGTTVPIVAIFGKAGVGKTALALRVAHTVADQFPDGQLYISLRDVEAKAVDPAVALAIFLRELGVDSADIPENTDDRARMFRARLSHQRKLIVLDNAANEAQIRPLLPWSSGCAVIVTSRVGMSALAGAHLVALDVMPMATAIELLAAIVDPDGAISEPAAIREIAELCGYLPLALRIAGARLRPKPWRVTWLAERLRQESRRLNLLKIGDLEVRASFSLSYEGLTPSLQHAFRCTGVLPLEFAAWALAAVLDGDIDNAEELLEQLADAQLVEINGVDGTGLLRYKLHDLLRDFARECFAEAEPVEARHAVVSALLDQYIAMATVGAEILQPGAHTASSRVTPLAAAIVRNRPRQWFSAERANLIGLVHTAHDAGLWEYTWRLAQLLPAMFDWRADWQVWRRTQQLALSAARNGGDIAAETAILSGLGSLQRELGQFDSAVSMLTKSAELSKKQGDDNAWATALLHLGDTYRYQGLLNEAISTFTTAIDVFRQLDNQRSIAGCLNGRGDAQRGLSRWTESEQDIRQAIELYRDIDDPIEVARAIIRYAMVFRDRGHYDTSAPLFNEALDTFRELADRRWEAQALRHLGVVRRQRGEIDTAIRLLSQCLLIFDELVDRRGMACTIRNRGDAYRWAKDYDNATDDLRQALRIFTEIGDRRWSGRTQLGLAGISRAHQDWDQALTLARGALDIFTDIGDRPGEGRAYRDIGIILRDHGRDREAAEALSRSREIYQSLGDELWVARVLVAEGRRDEAVELCRRNDITDPDAIGIVLKEW